MPNTPSSAADMGDKRRSGNSSPPSAPAPNEPRSFAESRGQTGQDLETGASQAIETWRQAMDPFTALQMDMTRWLDNFWRRSTGMAAPMLRPAGVLSAFAPSPAVFGLPPCDLRETEQAYTLSVELPGLTREDIKIQIDENALKISGHKAEEHQDSGAAYRISERRFGRFERTFPAPPDVDASSIDAVFKDGVLKVTLPRQQTAKGPSRKIAVK